MGGSKDPLGAVLEGRPLEERPDPLAGKVAAHLCTWGTGGLSEQDAARFVPSWGTRDRRSRGSGGIESSFALLLPISELRDEM